MKKFLLKLILIIVAGVLVYQYRDVLSAQLSPVWDNVKSFIYSQVPCKEPIPYTLNTFDKEFNISQKYFLSALADAEAIWEKSAGVELFAYEPTSSAYNVLKINLIYDYRQQATSKLASLGITVKDNRASYDALKVKFTNLKTELTKAENEYRLSREEATRIKINEMVDEINSMVVVLNRLATTLNLAVEKYNTIGASRGESFEEGVYIQEGSNRQIDIYEFSNRDKLVRVLAHELGHALGLGHVDDKKAIMYEFNQGNNKALTTSDIEALKSKCDIINR